MTKAPKILLRELRPTGSILLASLLSLLAAGCRDGAHHGVGEACSLEAPCRPLLACVAGRCTAPPADGGADRAGPGRTDGPIGSADASETRTPATDVAAEAPAQPPTSSDAGLDDSAPDQAPLPPDPQVPAVCYGKNLKDHFVGYEVPFCLTAVPWPQRRVPICWAPESARRPDFSTLSRRVESFLREQFMRPTALELSGWGTCSATADAGLAGRVVLALAEGVGWSAPVGYGAGGERRLQLGVGAPVLEASLIESFIQVLGLTYVGGRRDPSPPQLQSNEAAALQVFFGRRSGGTIAGVEARCLEAPVSAGGVVQAGTIEAGECRAAPSLDWQWSPVGRLSVVGRPELVLEVDGTGQRAQLSAPRAAAAEQVWAIKRAALRTDGDKCLGVPGGQFSDGALVKLVTCDGSAGQQWEPDLAGGRIRHGDFCLTGSLIPTIEGQPAVRVERCGAPTDPADAQTFTFAGNNQIRFRDRCLNVLFDKNSDGADVALYPCSATLLNGNDLFYFQGQIENAGRCLQMPAPPARGAIAIVPCGPDATQRWDIRLRPIR